jgi:hypothetical protein
MSGEGGGEALVVESGGDGFLACGAGFGDGFEDGLADAARREIYGEMEGEAGEKRTRQRDRLFKSCGGGRGQDR